MESILTSVKKMLGPGMEHTMFDVDIIIHINSVFAILTQMGVGPSEGFMIEDDTATWLDFTADSKTMEFVKTYVYLKTKLVFDPPDRSAVLQAYQESIRELEFRLHVDGESNS